MVLIYDMTTGNAYELEAAKPLSGDRTNPPEAKFLPTPRLREVESTASVHEQQLLPTLQGADIERFLASMESDQN
jgi:hypothetical protein